MATGYEVTITTLQAQIAGWTDHNFPLDDAVDIASGTAEEVGELCRAALKRKQRIRGTEEEWTAEIQKEVGDIFIKLCHMAAVEGFDLHDAIVARWREVRQRDWVVDPIGHGMGES